MPQRAMIRRIMFLPWSAEQYPDAWNSFFTDLRTMNIYDDIHCHRFYPDGSTRMVHRIELYVSVTQDNALLDLLPQMASAIGEATIETYSSNIMQGHH